MTVDYNRAMNRIADQLHQVASGRIVTRSYKDFSLHTNEDLKRGIFTVLSQGVNEYPSIEPPGEFGRQGVIILFQGLVDEDASGAELDQIEFNAINLLEQLAKEHNEAQMPAFILRSCRQSSQLEAPYCWVRSEWENWTDPNLT